MHTAEASARERREPLTLSIVSHGQVRLLVRLMQDLQNCESLIGTKVVVTLNLHDEEFDPRKFPSLDVVVIRNAFPKGFGANHNAAFQLCSTAWFGILNPDLRVPDRHCFEKILRRAESQTRLALVAPVVRNANGQIEDSARFNLTLPSLLARRRRQPFALPDTSSPSERGNPFYWLAGMCLLVRADVYRELRGFDERYFLYCEDYDLSARIFNAGYALTQTSNSHVVHDAQRDSHRSWMHLKLHLFSLLKVWCSSAFWRIWWYEHT